MRDTIADLSKKYYFDHYEEKKCWENKYFKKSKKEKK